MPRDPSNGYEAVAAQFASDRSQTGAETVRAWCRELRRGASVLDLACGTGVPVTEVLLEEGCTVRAVDASPTLVAGYRRRFPQVPVACEAAEESTFFGETYDGIVAIGLLFLLQPDVQLTVIARVAAALKAGGRFLFTAPVQVCSWTDILTGRESISLGDEAYRHALAAAGLQVVGQSVDEGDNHHYAAARLSEKPENDSGIS